MDSPPKPKRIKLWMVVALVGTVLIGSGWLIDFPALADRQPRPLSGMTIGADTVFYVYSLGGFIDREYCWRIDATEADLAQIIKHLELESSSTVPKEFWRLPPFYWPRSLRPGMISYRSAMFLDDARGSDGAHYFLLHDSVRSRAYVLFRDNF